VDIDQCVADGLDRALTEHGAVDGLECIIRTARNEIRSVVIAARVITVSGIPHVIAIYRDVTDRKKMEEAMFHNAKMASLGGIAAGVAHEINNPLGIVMQSAQNLQNRLDPDFAANRRAAAEAGLDLEALRKYVAARKILVFTRDIQSATRRAAAIIRNMLEFSRKGSACKQWGDIGAVVEKSVQLVHNDPSIRGALDARRAEMLLDISPDIPPVFCSEVEIEQVLINLIRNAGQAMAEAVPAVVEPQVRVRAWAEQEFAVIEVEDNGPGIPPEVQARIFDPFFTTKPPGQGTGLGLSISYFIVTNGHAGEMAVRSAMGHGAVFTIKLPLGRQPSGDDGTECLPQE
jgi:signal transduction histidine kinase